MEGLAGQQKSLWGQANIQVAPQKVQQAGFDTNGQTRSELRNAVAGANNDDANNPHAVGGSLGESAGAKKLQFTYTDTNWDKWDLCKSGLKQSPINLKRPYFGAFLKLQLKYKEQSWPTQMNDGMVLKVPFKQDGSVLQIGDKEYTPVEAIVRSPSEHKLDGKAYDMEMQVMHKDSLGNQIGISVLMEVTDKLPKEFYIENVFGHFFSNLPKSGNQRRIESMNLKWILSEKMLSHYVQYHGSLTHPPCSEGVEWFVLGKPWLIEKKWLQNYKTVLSDNARPVNDQNDRVLTSF